MPHQYASSVEKVPHDEVPVSLLDKSADFWGPENWDNRIR